MDTVIVGRLVLSFIVGVIIGFDRERSGKAAGIRTQMLVCVGSALLASISVHIGDAFGKPTADPARLMAQIVTGIGFLGAGVIIKNGNKVQGVTTAATIWITAALGIAIGSGFYLSAVVTTILVLLLNPIAKLQYQYGLKGDFYTIKVPFKYEQLLEKIFDMRLVDVRQRSVLSNEVKALIHSSHQSNREIIALLKKKKIPYEITLTEE